MAITVGGVIVALEFPQSGKNSKWDSWTIDGSMCEAFNVSPGTSWSQLVMARWRVLTVGFNGSWAGETFSVVFGRPQSIRARTVQSCFDVVANAINNVPAEGDVSTVMQIPFQNLLLSEHMAAWVIKSSEETTLSNSVCDSNHFPLFWAHKTLNRPFVVMQTKADFEWFGWQGPITGAWDASYR